MDEESNHEVDKQREKRLFTIPNAKEIAKLERGKLKVKSYFKSQFGNRLPAGEISKGQETLVKTHLNAPSRSTNSTCTANQSAILKDPANRTTDFAVDASEETNIETSRTGVQSVDRDLEFSASSAYSGSEQSTSRVADGEGVGAKRKIGSAFADRFSALREGADYEEPVVKRSMLPTAVVTAPIATGAKGPAGANTIVVNTRQRGNPILKHVRNVPWEFGDIVPDYVMGRTVCALYLSLRYHHLNPNYIHDRLKDLGHHYDLRVLLVQVDVKDPHHSLKELARMALLADCTLILAWSTEEAGRYLETYKSYENKSADALKEKIETDYLSKVTDVLSTVRSVNKTDAVTLVSTFGTFDKILSASKEDLYLCPGFGPQKARRLYDVLHEPFLKATKDARKVAAKEIATAETAEAI